MAVLCGRRPAPGNGRQQHGPQDLGKPPHAAAHHWVSQSSAHTPRTHAHRQTAQGVLSRVYAGCALLVTVMRVSFQAFANDLLITSLRVSCIPREQQHASPPPPPLSHTPYTHTHLSTQHTHTCLRGPAGDGGHRAGRRLRHPGVQGQPDRPGPGGLLRTPGADPAPHDAPSAARSAAHSRAQTQTQDGTRYSADVQPCTRPRQPRFGSDLQTHHTSRREAELGRLCVRVRRSKRRSGSRTCASAGASRSRLT